LDEQIPGQTKFDPFFKHFTLPLIFPTSVLHSIKMLLMLPVEWHFFNTFMDLGKSQIT